MESCQHTQSLIDQSAENTLSTLDSLKVNLHTLVCTKCREYKNRNQLFKKYVFGQSVKLERTNSYQEEIIHKSPSVQDRLASFPEQNPSPILEIEKSGKISYQNPAFSSRFPHAKDLTLDHDFLNDLKLNFDNLVAGKQKEFAKEITYNGTHYIKRATYLNDLQVVRVFYLDITEQKKYEKIISEKNKEITESIKYAKRLQEAILPSNSALKSAFNESFVLYKPKDIVAGDFYWLAEVNEWTFIAAADCTGHGVPGAMVSMVCNNALNRSVKEFALTDAGKVLDKTREIVLETFTNTDSDVKDGMDISLMAINNAKGKIYWSGANNPLWYYSENALHEITANKQPIGKTDQPTPFTTHELKLNLGDQVFLFTDGYADQFGGEKEKKFKYKQLQELLVQNHHKSPEELKTLLDTTICSWKGKLEQTDDILVIGIKF